MVPLWTCSRTVEGLGGPAQHCAQWLLVGAPWFPTQAFLFQWYSSFLGWLSRAGSQGSRSRRCRILKAELRLAQRCFWHILLVKAAPCHSRFNGSEMGILMGGWQVGGGYRTGICGHVSPLPHPEGGDHVAFLSFSRRRPWVQGGHTPPLCYLGHVEFGCRGLPSALTGSSVLGAASGLWEICAWPHADLSVGRTDTSSSLLFLRPVSPEGVSGTCLLRMQPFPPSACVYVHMCVCAHVRVCARVCRGALRNCSVLSLTPAN